MVILVMFRWVNFSSLGKMEAITPSLTTLAGLPSEEWLKACLILSTSVARFRGHFWPHCGQKPHYRKFLSLPLGIWLANIISMSSSSFLFCSTRIRLVTNHEICRNALFVSSRISVFGYRNNDRTGIGYQGSTEYWKFHRSSTWKVWQFCL